MRGRRGHNSADGGCPRAPKSEAAIYPLPGFKRFADAAVTSSGIELMQKIRKGQFDTVEVASRGGGREPQVWESLLAA